MTRPLPRWYRRRCRHLNQTALKTWFGSVVLRKCDDCGATF